MRPPRTIRRQRLERDEHEFCEALEAYREYPAFQPGLFYLIEELVGKKGFKYADHVTKIYISERPDVLPLGGFCVRVCGFPLLMHCHEQIEHLAMCAEESAVIAKRRARELTLAYAIRDQLIPALQAAGIHFVSIPTIEHLIAANFDDVVGVALHLPVVDGSTTRYCGAVACVQMGADGCLVFTLNHMGYSHWAGDPWKTWLPTNSFHYLQHWFDGEEEDGPVGFMQRHPAFDGTAGCLPILCQALSARLAAIQERVAARKNEMSGMQHYMARRNLDV